LLALSLVLALYTGIKEFTEKRSKK